MAGSHSTHYVVSRTGAVAVGSGDLQSAAPATTVVLEWFELVSDSAG